ncbi:PREDICTED: LOW QUALITY PROTEIN: disintegrin and metalloproteinase domain-containing protein 32-like [Corvus brachyrhynchos]|uniref:LOW QUALITY PROTEIN: disintegrin and metalloproteinase domain-containing protein 32-like n=1 Tax=Corvus brachyrhynchos TaxID=85066 RepID=UPI0008166E61|nr:PREDICTED: LOW QUALITY PROTEIN: disintegrin and metalloproteinase domain-containing protein 32-like [Corvus brachyrhynchos]
MHKDAVSYILRIEGRPYTIHLQQHAFLSDDFQTYTSSKQGSLHSDSAHTEGGCHYWGYIDGFPSSAVTLNTCSGLRGLLQFENVSYGIEPLGYSPSFQHMLYRVSEEHVAEALPAHSPPEAGLGGLAAREMLDKAHGDDEPLSAAAQSPKYLTVYVVLDKALYNYMGSDPNAATQKIIQAFNLINNMFNPLNITIVLSSLELWEERDKVSTAGDTDDLLQRFLQWKQLSLEPQVHNIASLLGYRDQGAFTGAAAPGAACQRDAAAAVALVWSHLSSACLSPAHMAVNSAMGTRNRGDGSMWSICAWSRDLCKEHSAVATHLSPPSYHGNVTLESFSVLLAQVLGHSLGMSSDSSRGCGCPGRVCVMSPEALRFSGAKAFSNCSIRDFETFLKQGRGVCLFDRPRLSRRSGAVCGNGVVEPGEQCDCGTAQQCLKDKCCTRTCTFKPKAKCSSGLCCKSCQFKRRNSLCRPAADFQCDLPEFCSGSPAPCCCCQGRCQSLDLQCKRLYGRDSKNAPVVCYEEINSQRDRFGHCGFKNRHGYRPCAWRDLRCGKLICTYPSQQPFPSAAAAVIYARVRHHLCVSLNYLNVSAPLDQLLVPPGTKCGSGRVCINNTCHPHSVLGYSCDSEAKCHGHGVCNNKGNCHCHPGWQPPDCRRKGSRLGGSTDSGLQLTEGGECGQPGRDGVGRAGSALCPAGLSPARPAPAASTGGWGDGLAGAGLQPRSARPHRGPRPRPVAAAGAGPVPRAAATGHGGHQLGQGAGARPGAKSGARPRAGPRAADRPKARARPGAEDRHGPNTGASAGQHHGH